MTWVSTRALVEGKEPGYGAGCGGVAIFPCAAGLCSYAPHTCTALPSALQRAAGPARPMSSRPLYHSLMSYRSVFPRTFDNAIIPTIALIYMEPCPEHVPE